MSSESESSNETLPIEDQLLHDREESLTTVKLMAVSTLLAGLMFFVALEGLANFSSITSFSGEWVSSVGIGDADATVVVTALLLLVASLNVALAALLIKDTDTVISNFGAFTWASTATVIGRVAGATSTALALTRAFESPALCLILLGLTAMTITLTSSISLREGIAQTTLDVAVSKIELGKIRAAIEMLHIQPTLPKPGKSDVCAARAAALRGFVHLIWLVPVNTLLVLAVNIEWSGVIVGLTNTAPATTAVRLALLTLGVLLLMTIIYTLFGFIRIVDLFYQARGWRWRAIVVRGAYVGGSLLFLSSVLTLPSLTSWPTRISLLPFVLVPQLIVFAWSVVGSRLGRGSSAQNSNARPFDLAIYAHLLDRQQITARNLSHYQNRLSTLTGSRPFVDPQTEDSP